MYKVRLYKTSKCLWPVYINKHVCYEMIFFFKVFINSFLKICGSVFRKTTINLLYFWDVYDVSLWEKLIITVKVCFTETRLKPSHELRVYFLKITREMINGLTTTAFHYFSWWTSFRSRCSEQFCKKGVFKISQNLQQKPVATACDFIEKETC